MEYTNIRDILPQLVVATEAGKLKWAVEGDDDYSVVLGGYRVEVERFLRNEKTGQEAKGSINLWLWNNERKIIDSYQIEEDREEYSIYLGYFLRIQRSARDIPGVLSHILNSIPS